MMSELQQPIDSSEFAPTLNENSVEPILVDEDGNEQAEQSFDDMERAIAEMHVEPTLLVPDQSVKEEAAEEKPKCLQSQIADNESAKDNVAAIENAAEHEDLLAVLKGIDQHTPEKESPEMKQLGNERSTSATDSELAEGVTIEGEGQFQIMEVVDDEDIAYVSPTALATGNNAPISPNLSKAYGSASTSKMTKEEERAMAMEQIAGLKFQLSERQRRRKQDIKAMQVENADLACKLGEEWSDDDQTIEQIPTVPSKTSQNNTTSNSSGAATSQKPKITSMVVLPNSIKEEEIALKTTEPEVNAQQVTGFKRTRVIKRKIIWDPDAPETQISYAQLVRSSGKPNTPAVPNSHSTTSKNASPSLTTTIKSATIIKKELPVKKVRRIPQKDKKPPIITENVDIKKPTRASTPYKSFTIKVTSNAATQSAKSSNEEPVARVSSPAKRRSQTPISNGAGGYKKKKITEIDRLMGDEGAVNMLNSLESERGRVETVESDNKPHKPLMRSRAMTFTEKISPVAAVVKKEPPSNSKNKRAVKPKASTDWDYVYKQKASEDSMIIRRRSNSSYSSNASLHRSSLDSSFNSKVNAETPEKVPDLTEQTPSKVTTKAHNSNDSGKHNMPSTSKTFEFAKPESKSKSLLKQNRRTKSPLQVPTSQLTSDMKNDQITTGKRGTRSPVEEKEKNNKQSTTKASTSPPSNSAAEVVVKKSGKVAQIVFSTDKSHMEYTFSTQLMDRIVEILKKLSVDVDCNVVVMITHAPHFCQGIDLTELTLGSSDKRKNSAVKLAKSVKNYLKAIATFPKPLIVAVNGNNFGLGVTQLALFDIVVASDKSSYETPYAKFGQTPEGYCIWNNMSKIRGSLKTKLFWLCEKISETEAVLSGLVNKLAASSKVNDDAINLSKKIAANSAESYRIMKQTIIRSRLDVIATNLDEEFDTIVSQWTSSECHASFKKYLESRQQ